MVDIDSIIKFLQNTDNQVTSTIIKDLITDNKSRADKMKKLYQSFKGEVPILNRSFKDTNKINNKLANDYRGLIISQIIGYIYGSPITYQIDDKKYNETIYNNIKNNLSDFNIMNSVDDLDSTTGKYTSICGYGARLLYIDRDGKERLMNLPPWEVIFIEDGSTSEIQYALRYYPITVREGDKTVYRNRVEWYDNTSITFYVEDKDGNYFLDATEEKNPLLHMFKYVPIIKFKNNDEEQGDFEKVETTIDSYDELLSDCQNEISELRLAYMIFYGVDINEETMEKARRTGAFGGLDGKNGEKVEFLIKQINDAFIENQKKTLDRNIFKFSSTVDMNDEQFSGSAMSGESRKWKLKSLEDKAIIKERKYSAALRNQFKVLCSSWNTKSIPLNYLDIYWNFQRNIPVDLLYEAEVQEKLIGKVSNKTRLSYFSGVDDPEWEMKQMDEENQGSVNLDNI